MGEKGGRVAYSALRVVVPNWEVSLCKPSFFSIA